RCFEQIKGFGDYGFPESHAQAFAWLAYVSSWLKCHHPAAFTCALLNSQPMGFYAPAQLVGDARAHGVEVRPIDVAASDWDNSLEDDGPRRGAVLRLGLRQIDGFRQDWALAIMAVRAGGAFVGAEDLARRAALPPRALRLLADADALGSLGHNRRAAGWEVRRIAPRQLSLFAAMEAPELGVEADPALPPMPPGAEVVADYQTTRLSLKAHPLGFLRATLDAEGIASCAVVNGAKDGARLRCAGVVLVRQRPGKGNAVFITIEDETGVVNALLWARDFEAQRAAVMAARLMEIEGVAQRSPEGVVHLMARRVRDRSALLARIGAAPGDQPPLRAGHPRDVRILPPSRDFH
ncbi:MAG: error-prone DNA polymerase, partial [Proteobacteria bacterium]|nr:error-prone DNA polymerase [Pseudomonadota bacterium]